MKNNKNNIYIKYLKTQLGELILGSFENKLCLCDWKYRKMRNTIDHRLQYFLSATYVEKETEIIKKAEKQIQEYLQKQRCTFDVELLMIGTEFQKKVWHELCEIPFGETRSYLDLAKALNNEKAVRAVASANGANAISLFIPCHRIIGSTGELVGYAGGLPAKKKLLELEEITVNSPQLSLF